MNTEIIQNFTNNFQFASNSFVTFFGVIGNSLVLYILSRKIFRNIPMFRYFLITTIFQLFQLALAWIPSFAIIDINLSVYGTSIGISITFNNYIISENIFSTKFLLASNKKLKLYFSKEIILLLK
jgi:hypothetical protein